MSADAPQATFTPPAPHVDSTVHGVHGAYPETEKVVPALHSAVLQHAASDGGVAAALVLSYTRQVLTLTPAAFFALMHLQAVNAAPPSVISPHVAVKAATSHTVSAVVLHSVFTPAAPHVEAAAHVVHGSFPVSENDVPPTQGGTAPLQTVSEPGAQAVFTPAAPHVEFAAHVVHADPGFDAKEPFAQSTQLASKPPFPAATDLPEMQLVQVVELASDHLPTAQSAHGPLPDAEKVAAAHASHTRSAVLLQAVFTPAVPHVAVAAQGAQGALPLADHVELPTHAATSLSTETVALSASHCGSSGRPGRAPRAMAVWVTKGARDRGCV